MEFASKFFDNFIALCDAMSIYIIVGLLFAGILKQLIPDNFVSSHLGKDSTKSVIKATLFGIPLPVCSCSVIPLAQALRKEGASKGSVQSFLISTPITGVDSILATYSLFGLVFTLFRVVSSIVIAISVGLIQNIVQKENNENIKEIKSTCSCIDIQNKKFSFFNALKYGYGTLFEDMAKALFIGLIIGTLFITFTPKEYTQILFENQILTYFVVMLFAMPLYTCATASLPIAAAFMIQGMSAGAVFIFLTAGPATSAVTMSVIYKMLGKVSLFIYVITIAFLSLAFGYIYDTFFSQFGLTTVLLNENETNFFNTIFTSLMLLLICYHLLKNIFKKVSNKKQIDEPNFIFKKTQKLSKNTKFSIKSKK